MSAWSKWTQDKTTHTHDQETKTKTRLFVNKTKSNTYEKTFTTSVTWGWDLQHTKNLFKSIRKRKSRFLKSKNYEYQLTQRRNSRPCERMLTLLVMGLTLGIRKTEEHSPLVLARAWETNSLVWECKSSSLYGTWFGRISKCFLCMSYDSAILLEGSTYRYISICMQENIPRLTHWSAVLTERKRHDNNNQTSINKGIIQANYPYYQIL